MFKKSPVLFLAILPIFVALIVRAGQPESPASITISAMGMLGRGWINNIAMSPDTTPIAVSSSVVVGRYDTDALLTAPHLLHGQEQPISSAVFSPDGRLMASASWDTTIMIWDATTREPLHTLKGHNSDVNTIAFSP